MNTPKKIRRYDGHATIEESHRKKLEGTYDSGIENQKVAYELAAIASSFVHLEASMSNILAALLDHRDNDTAGYILRAIKSPKARVDVMKDLLELAPANKALPSEFDGIIAEFSRLSKRRNALVHGLWYTHCETKRCYIEERDEHGWGFMTAREIDPKELSQLADEIWKHNIHTARYAVPFLYCRQEALAAVERGEVPDLPSLLRDKQKSEGAS